jgi:predicted dehydrogenase
MPAKMKEVRCALIGYGGTFNMGKFHGEQINAVPGMRVTAACDVDAQRVKQAAEDFPGIETFTDVKALLKSPHVDLCVLILPHNLHAPVALQCLKAGKHVILEKPMCITTAEAKAMIDLARKRDLMLTVFHNRRHDGDFKALRQAIADGLLGEVFSIEMWDGGYGKPRTWWRSKKEISGGAFYDWGAHFLDWLLNIVPSPVVNVNGYFQKRVWRESSNEDHVQAVIRFANGTVANVQMSGIAHHSLPRWRVLGTQGAVVSGDTGFDYYTEHEGVKVKGLLPYQKETWQNYYPNIGAHLLKGAELDVKPEEAARTIAIMEAAEKSSKTGKAEPLPAWLG